MAVIAEQESKCGYCFQVSEKCRIVQLSANMRDPKEWQQPIWVCPRCRYYLRGNFRYFAGKE